MTTIFIISAPSGSGKSTLVNHVRRTVPRLAFSISYSTRPPRGSEQNGREYFFISRDEFQKMIARDEFLEYAEVFGNYYGTARRFLRQAEADSNDLLLDIDVQGAEQIKAKLPQAVSIFILPPNRAELEQRLRGRSQDSDAVIARRLDEASREIENYRKYDYILVNDRLDESVEGLNAIILSERLCRAGQSDEALRRRAEIYRLEAVRPRLKPILRSFLKTAGE